MGVITVDVTDTDYFGPIEFAPPNTTERCSGVYISQTNDGSEFIGTITIIGGTDPGGGGTSGNTITINETISDNCNIYNNKCDDKSTGDFSATDFNNNDWHTPNRF